MFKWSVQCFGTVAVLALGPHSCPVVALGCLPPHIGPVPIWGGQCWNRAPHLGTENLILNLSATLTGQWQYGDINIPGQHWTKMRFHCQQWNGAKMGANIYSIVFICTSLYVFVCKKFWYIVCFDYCCPPIDTYNSLIEILLI